MKKIFRIPCCVALVMSVLLSWHTTEPVQIDGYVNEQEWKAARELKLVNGGRLLWRQEGNSLLLALVVEQKAWVHIYLGTKDSVRILHASAALGDALYIHQQPGWHAKKTFDWALRDKLYDEKLVGKQEDHYQAKGWVANNNNMGDGKTFEFKIRLDDASRPVYIACVLAQPPMDLHFFPAALSDHTVFPPLVQGNTPDSLQFSPEHWYVISKAE